MAKGQANKQVKREAKEANKGKVFLTQTSVFPFRMLLSAGADKRAGYPKWKLYITFLFYLQKKFFHVLI